MAIAEPGVDPARVPPDPNDVPREALLYLPGLNLGSDRKTITGVVSRLERALDTDAPAASDKWRVEWSELLVKKPATPDPSKPLATIFRKAGADERPVLDVFEFDWSTQLIADFEGQSLFRRAARVAFALVKVWEIPRRFIAAGKTEWGKSQLFLAMVMLLAMTVYAGVLAVAVIETGVQVWDVTGGEDEQTTAATTTTTAAEGGESVSDAPPADSSDDPGVSNWQRFAILGGLAMGFFKKQGDRLRSAGSSLFAAESYIRLARRKSNMMGELRDLCENLAEQRLADGTSEKYTAVRIIGYSFGAIVAIDSLFPREALPARSFGVVKSLATIGAPYDFVRAVRPSWSEDRHVPDEPPTWVNIYSPIDLLGSNFRKKPDAGDATRGLTTTGAAEANGVPELVPAVNEPWDVGIDLTLLNMVQLYGFTSHGMYWGDDDSGPEVNVFDLLVRRLYVGSPLLS